MFSACPLAVFLFMSNCNNVIRIHLFCFIQVNCVLVLNLAAQQAIFLGTGSVWCGLASWSARSCPMGRLCHGIQIRLIDLRTLSFLSFIRHTRTSLKVKAIALNAAWLSDNMWICLLKWTFLLLLLYILGLRRSLRDPLFRSYSM